MPPVDLPTQVVMTAPTNRTYRRDLARLSIKTLLALDITDLQKWHGAGKPNPVLVALEAAYRLGRESRQEAEQAAQDVLDGLHEPVNEVELQDAVAAS